MFLAGFLGRFWSYIKWAGCKGMILEGVYVEDLKCLNCARPYETAEVDFDIFVLRSAPIKEVLIGNKKKIIIRNQILRFGIEILGKNQIGEAALDMHISVAARLRYSRALRFWLPLRFFGRPQGLYRRIERDILSYDDSVLYNALDFVIKQAMLSMGVKPDNVDNFLFCSSAPGHRRITLGG